MRLEHEFTLPIPPEKAWETLLDIPRVARCMPGATLDRSEGDEFSGRVTLKVGPLRMAYRGDARITEKDATARRLVITAVGKEAKGAGTAEATVTVSLHADAAGTRAEILTDLALTGRAAQFGRGLVNEVGGTVIGQFADRLSHEMSGAARPEQDLPPVPEPAPSAAGSAPDTPDTPAAVRDEPAGDAALDVVSLVKPVLASRGGRLAGGVLGLLVAFLLGRRGRRSPSAAARSPLVPALVIVAADRRQTDV